MAIVRRALLKGAPPAGGTSVTVWKLLVTSTAVTPQHMSALATDGASVKTTLHYRGEEAGCEKTLNVRTALASTPCRYIAADIVCKPVTYILSSRKRTESVCASAARVLILALLDANLCSGRCKSF